MTAIPEPSDVITHARLARKRDAALAMDIASLGTAQVRGALYWLASDPDGLIHVAVNAAVQGQVAAALPAEAQPASEGITVWTCGCGDTVANVRPDDGLCPRCKVAEAALVAKGAAA